MVLLKIKNKKNKNFWQIDRVLLTWTLETKNLHKDCKSYSYPNTNIAISFLLKFLIKKVAKESTYCFIVSELKPGFILHGAFAQINGWRETEGNIKRAGKFVKKTSFPLINILDSKSITIGWLT